MKLAAANDRLIALPEYIEAPIRDLFQGAPYFNAGAFIDVDAALDYIVDNLHTLFRGEQNIEDVVFAIIRPDIVSAEEFDKEALEQSAVLYRQVKDIVLAFINFFEDYLEEVFNADYRFYIQHKSLSGTIIVGLRELQTGCH